MKALLLAASAALLVTACSSTNNDDVVETAPPAGMAASTYVQNAASSDMFEIQSGQLALQRSCDPTVRSFAQMLIDDHTRTTSMLTQAAAQAGVTMPPMTMAPHHAAMLQRLQAATGTNFEAAFRNEQVMAHQEALDLHRTYADTGDRPALRTVASGAVPVIQAHLNQAQNLPTMATCATPQTEQPTRRQGERG